MRGSICLLSPNMGRFWGGADPPGRLFLAGFLFLPLPDLGCLLNIGSLDIIGPVALSCIRFYLPAMVVVAVVVIVVAVFVNVTAVVVLGSGRPTCGPLPPYHLSTGENTKACD